MDIRPLQFFPFVVFSFHEEHAFPLAPEYFVM